MDVSVFSQLQQVMATEIKMLMDPEAEHSADQRHRSDKTRASGDADSRTQRGHLWKVVMRDGILCNPPAGYEQLQDPQERLRLSSLLAVQLQPRMTGGVSWSEVVDLCGPHTASCGDEVQQWDSFGIDAGIADIVCSKTAVSVTLKIADLDEGEGHTVWCIPDTASSITPHGQNPSACNGSSSAAGPKKLLERSAQQTGAERALVRANQPKEKKATRAFVTQFNLYLQDVLAYGDCQFDSVAHCLLRHERIRTNDSTLITDVERADLGKDLRAAAVGCMRKNRRLFEPFFGAKGTHTCSILDDKGDEDFDGYLVRMSEPLQYGDEFTLKALAMEKNLNIQVFHWNSTFNDIRITLHSFMDGDATTMMPDAANVVATPGTVNVFHHVWQHGGEGHFNSIEQTEV
jgi:hypothetical protein